VYIVYYQLTGADADTGRNVCSCRWSTSKRCWPCRASFSQFYHLHQLQQLLRHNSGSILSVYIRLPGYEARGTTLSLLNQPVFHRFLLSLRR